VLVPWLGDGAGVVGTGVVAGGYVGAVLGGTCDGSGTPAGMVVGTAVPEGSDVGVADGPCAAAAEPDGAALTPPMAELAEARAVGAAAMVADVRCG
jgi:hypothetical protein